MTPPATATTDVTANGPTASVDRPAPTRHREGEARNRRIGRLLRTVARVRTLDEELMADIGAGFLRRDEPGAALAAAMKLPAGDPGRVTMGQFRTALAEGIGAVDAAPAALRDFFAEVDTPPGWLDEDLLARGQRVYHRFGQNAGDVLLQLSLIGGYRFGGPTDLLVATGGLTGGSAIRRLAETQYWAASLSGPGALRRDGHAWQLTVHVRAMHALVNHAFTPRWDLERWGYPISQSDQAATLGLFDGVVLLGSRALGVPIPPADARAVMHLWRYVGWLLGVEERYLVHDERERHRLNYHLLLAQTGITEAGPQLTHALVEGQRQLHHPNLPRLRGWFARERLLSMLTVFLGRRSMRELGLPLRPPWAHALAFLRNTWRYRTPWGRAGLDDWADRTRERILSRHFGDATYEVGRLG